MTPRLCLTLLSILLSACATPAAVTPPQSANPPAAPSSAAEPDPLLIAEGREWRLVELMGQAVKADAGGRVPTLSFKLDGQGLRVSGHNGCNGFFGQAEQGAPLRLRFDKLASTLRACPDMSLEQQFMQMLERTDSYHADAKQLQLHRARMSPLARFEPAAP